jgi:carbon storage regulator
MTMLVLTRQVGEEICIGEDIRVRVVALRGGQVRIGIEAPRTVPVYREELLQAVRAANELASRPDPAALSWLRKPDVPGPGGPS